MKNWIKVGKPYLENPGGSVSQVRLKLSVKWWVWPMILYRILKMRKNHQNE